MIDGVVVGITESPDGPLVTVRLAHGQGPDAARLWGQRVTVRVAEVAPAVSLPHPANEKEWAK